MIEINLTLLPEEEMPVTDEVKKKPKVNCLQDRLLELMNERKLTDADIVRETKIPWSTWHGWITGDVSTQLADENLKKIFTFFNVHLEYLLYGIGDDSPAFEVMKNDESA